MQGIPTYPTLMRWLTRRCWYLVVFVLLAFCCQTSLFAQPTVNLSIGAGLVEQYHVGINVEIDQWQVGILAGGNERIGYRQRSAGWSLTYHFWGQNKKYTQKNWYLSSGINYLHQQIDYFDYHHFFVNTRLGRTFNFSPKFGLAVEAGRLFDIHSRYIFDYENHPEGAICGNDSRFSTAYPKLSMNAKLIFRL